MLDGSEPTKPCDEDVVMALRAAALSCVLKGGCAGPVALIASADQPISRFAKRLPPRAGPRAPGGGAWTTTRNSAAYGLGAPVAFA